MNKSFNIKNILQKTLFEDKRFFVYTASYAVIVALINLSLPVSIQFLINSIANTALIQPIIIIGIILTFLLSFSAILSLMQKYLLEIYKRSSFVRLTSQLFLKSIQTDYKNFLTSNTNSLSSHYFEIFKIHYYASTLVIEGLITVLQILICFILSSLYHPYFMIMNIFAIIVIGISWQVFKNRGIRFAIERSESKYKVYDWLDDVFRLNSYFKSRKIQKYALNKSYLLINNYIEERKKYWRVSFTQLTLLTFLYVILAITLFVVGGILVVKGQLSLGQLVAAEILYSVALFGASKLSTYFDTYYSLIAAADEVYHVFALPNEANLHTTTASQMDNEAQFVLKLDKLSYLDYSKNVFTYNFSIKKNSLNLAHSFNDDKKSLLVGLLNNLIKATSGQIHFLNLQYSDYNPQDIRDYIWTIDSSDIFSTSIREFLNHGYGNILDTEINNILAIVGLSSVVTKFTDGLATNLIGNGYPLHNNQIIQLKIARAILHKPMVLIITDVLHKVDPDLQVAILDYIKNFTKIALIHIAYEKTINQINYDQIINLDENIFENRIGN